MKKSNKKTTAKDSSKRESLEALDNKTKRKLKKTIQAVLSLMFLGLSSYLYINNPDFFKTNEESVSCRIGITMDLERRKQEWKTEYLKKGIVIKKWTVLSTHQSKSSAQAVETREAKKQNCEAHPGGRGAEKAIWHVYKIEY